MGKPIPYNAINNQTVGDGLPVPFEYRSNASPFESTDYDLRHQAHCPLRRAAPYAMIYT